MQTIEKCVNASLVADGTDGEIYMQVTLSTSVSNIHYRMTLATFIRNAETVITMEQKGLRRSITRYGSRIDMDPE